MRARTAPKPEQTQQAFRARDAYESAVAQAVLILLWIGVIQMFVLPLPRPLGTLLLLPAILAILGLAYFVWTWRHPSLSVAVTFSLTEILVVALFIPWAAWTLMPSGRTWEPVAAAQLATASIPLVAPPFLWLSFILVGVFAVELSATILYPQHLGLGLSRLPSPTSPSPSRRPPWSSF